MKPILYIIFSLLLSSNSVAQKKLQQYRAIEAIVKGIDTNTNKLVESYGSLMPSGSSSLTLIDSLLDPLRQLARIVKPNKFKLTLQSYIQSSNSLLQLSKNNNLNLPAFSATLSTLDKARSELWARIDRALYRKRSLLSSMFF